MKPLNKLLDRNLDHGLALAVIFLMIIGVVMIHSAGTGMQMESGNFWVRQLLWVVISVMVMFAMTLLPVRVFSLFAYPSYALGLILLIMTDISGSMGGGSERWLVLAGFRFQPSEFMKVATILTLARYLSDKQHRPTTLVKCIAPFMIALVPMVVILKQPDLGTSLVFAALTLPMIYWAGLDSLRLFFLVAPIFSAVFTAPFLPYFGWVTWVTFMFVLLGVLYLSRTSLQGMMAVIFTNIFAGIATPLAFNKMKPYQQMRITSFLNPEADPRGAGWQLINSKIAIGSGGLFGTGIGNGRYTKLGFLPRSHTDFIFSVISEEMGFVGAALVLILMFFVIVRGIMLATELKNPFMSLASMGIATLFAFHMFVNVGMVLQIMPVTGLPLPFLSYGGSACLTNAIMVGILLSFSVNRYEY